ALSGRGGQIGSRGGFVKPSIADHTQAVSQQRFAVSFSNRGSDPWCASRHLLRQLHLQTRVVSLSLRCKFIFHSAIDGSIAPSNESNECRRINRQWCRCIFGAVIVLRMDVKADSSSAPFLDFFS